MSNWLKDFKTAKTLVISVLRDNKRARSDDRELYVAVWEKQGLNLTVSQKTLFKKLLSAETIGRARRQVQETGLYRPPKEAYNQRQLLEEEVRNEITNEK